MRKELVERMIEDYKQREKGLTFMVEQHIDMYNSEKDNPIFKMIVEDVFAQHYLVVEACRELANEYELEAPKFDFEESLGIYSYSAENIAEGIYIKLQLDKGLSENPELRKDNSRTLKTLEILMKMVSGDSDFTITRFLCCDSFVECLAVMC